MLHNSKFIKPLQHNAVKLLGVCFFKKIKYSNDDSNDCENNQIVEDVPNSGNVEITKKVV